MHTLEVSEALLDSAVSLRCERYLREKVGVAAILHEGNSSLFELFQGFGENLSRCRLSLSFPMKTFLIFSLLGKRKVKETVGFSLFLQLLQTKTK